MSRKGIYFISDVHLGAPNAPRAEREGEDALIGFLRSVRCKAEVLYIVGDLFDFWFEYRSAIPSRGARVLFEIYALVQAGVRAVYISGNHDMWPGAYLSDQVGLELADGPISAVHQGLRLWIAHGDEFRHDWKFRISRAVLRNPACIAAFRLLHPDLGSSLARATSSISEFRAGRCSDQGREIYLRAARERLAEGFDVVLCGHYHRPLRERVDGGTLVILGDWIVEDTYAVLEDGEIEIKRWRPGRRGR